MLLKAVTFFCAVVPSLVLAHWDGPLSSSKRPHGNAAPHPAMPRIEVPDTESPTRNGSVLPPYSTVYYFDQLIDHDNPTLGTFQQRYWFTWEFYEKGGPIILSTPGESNAELYYGYLTNLTMPGQIAQPNHGATIVLEHRFFGQSNPYPDLSSASFRVHTVDQAIEDLAYFATNVHLPFPADVEDGANVGPSKNPWILVGGSYSGALTSWTKVKHPEIFYAGYASSAVVEAINYYWGYFEPIRQNMPKNCSADVERVIDYMDLTFAFGSTQSKQALKTKFGMPNVTHYDDVAGTLRNQLWTWQSLDPVDGGAVFYDFCDALEMKDGVAAGPHGWGLDHALDAWGQYSANFVSNLCYTTPQDECLGTYDSSLAYWHNTAVDQDWRSWIWMCCNEFGFWQDGAPLGWPSIVTRLVTPQYDERQCTYYFPEAFPTPRHPTTFQTNQKYDGWDVNEKRLFFVNAKKDPWREASVSSDYNPRISTPDQPIYVLDSGFHCSDLITRFNAAPDIKQVQDTAVATFTQWISEFVPGQTAKKRGILHNDISIVESRDETNSTLPPLDSNPPPVDLGTVNSGVYLNASQVGADPENVAHKNAWDLPPVQVGA